MFAVVYVPVSVRLLWSAGCLATPHREGIIEIGRNHVASSLPLAKELFCAIEEECGGSDPTNTLQFKRDATSLTHFKK